MVLRVSGFSSGLDIDSVVKQMMAAKRAPLDKLNQQKTLMEWQRDSYREFNAKLVDLKMNKLIKWNTSSQMNTQKAIVGGNTTAVRAEASSASNGVDMSVTVKQLATKSSLESASKLTTTSGTDKVILNTKLSDLSGATSPLTFVVDGGESITFTEDDTISTAMARINSGSGDIKATFDEVSGKLSITSNKFGADNVIENQKVSGSLLTLVKMDYSNTNASFFKAQEAIVEITSSKSATAEVYTSTSNSLTVNGVSLTFLAKSDTTGGATTIKTQADADKSVETIKAFVETYNELINTMATTIGEEKYRSYTPLTDEQKEAMSEKEIELWEKKAKSGLLKGDVILQTAISDMRSAITSKLGDLSEMGITTGQYYENGKIYLNEDKLKQAILDNPQKVSDIFRGSALEVNGGIFGALSTAADKALDKIVLKAGTSKFSTDLNFAYKTESVMGRMLKDYNSRINSLQDRLSDLETRYYKQFTAMETAMNKYNSQSSSLSSLFSS
ncbi:flagellar filament capping protein FliD [Paenibacillus sp. FSL R7-0273]|uniref:flagellar filament capping protein FliD n=1 Tax=Paenibacillus sp. FSL R7-0273 TaxID=1536772 RepID=UPI000A558D93|nr:flagellar filament capping protein FliD [Paenibacillus sp. FSL R7-0273]